MDFKKPTNMYPGMWQYPKNPNHCCIYRVPNSIREVNPQAYTPQLVLIGPLQYLLKSQAFKALEHGDDITLTKSMGYLNMEAHKKTYLAEFAARVEGVKTVDGFKRMIEEEEEILRESYSESTAWIKSQDFVEMVLHDSVFIIEFILRVTGKGEGKKGDPLMKPYLVHSIFDDLILLENQLPYYILEKIFNQIAPRIRPNKTFRNLVFKYFELQGMSTDKYSEFRHFTDLIRDIRVKTLYDRDVSKPQTIEHMYNANKLESRGVKFKATREKLSLYVSFENGCLKMPRILVDDKLEMTLRNIMALEQCHYPSNAFVCDYVFFLDYLIDTDKDVDLLVEQGVIENCIGEPASVAQMVNKLGLGIFKGDSYYSDIVLRVNEYYKDPVNKSKAILKRVYFGDLWTGTATIAATFLLLMTLVQTVASIIQVMQNNSQNKSG